MKAIKRMLFAVAGSIALPAGAHAAVTIEIQLGGVGTPRPSIIDTLGSAAGAPHHPERPAEAGQAEAMAMAVAVAVPAPLAWAMLVTGVGMMGESLRRRARVVLA